MPVLLSLQYGTHFQTVRGHVSATRSHLTSWEAVTSLIQLDSSHNALKRFLICVALNCSLPKQRRQTQLQFATMARVSKGVLGKTLTSLPLLALASAAWVVLLAGLAIAEHQGMVTLG